MGSGGEEGRIWQGDKTQLSQHLEQPPAQAEGHTSTPRVWVDPSMRSYLGKSNANPG